MSGGRAAAFLDRDGTIIRDASYISRPEDVELLPGAADALRRLNDAAIPVVVVSNQSGLGRGYFDWAAFRRVQNRVEETLAAQGARIDALYVCPHAPGADGSATCDCRKPGTALFLQAIEEHGLDPARCWFIGDRWRDVQPALALGGTGVLVPAPSTPPDEVSRAIAEVSVAPSLSVAVDRLLRRA